MEWIAASRALRVRTVLPRPACRCSRNAVISGASRSARLSALGCFPVRAAAKPSSSRNVSRFLRTNASVLAEDAHPQVKGHLTATSPFLAGGVTSSSEEKADGWYGAVYPLPVVRQSALTTFMAL